ncbi:lipopolysaccharide assembly protein LapA domain-containing protein [Desulfohalovibrio reitneri]|uniref:lipopolysaccharide assembly protein LapA domain-containing protein n=1 Tax=Desulfohalovibrio reitneri TaxID=1307759 RepID=UPI0004A6C1AF|nr:LapA family protein [Desulfohalovibrio reitneri]
MRYIKVLLLALLFVVAMIFFIQNTPVLSQDIQLKLEVLQWKWVSVPMPIYLFVLIAFLVGAVLSTLYFLVDKIRSGSELKAAQSKAKRLEGEVAELKKKQETASSFSSSRPSFGSSATPAAGSSDSSGEDEEQSGA